MRKFELEQPGYRLTVNTKNFQIELLCITTAFRSFWNIYFYIYHRLSLCKFKPRFFVKEPTYKDLTLYNRAAEPFRGKTDFYKKPATYLHFYWNIDFYRYIQKRIQTSLHFVMLHFSFDQNEYRCYAIILFSLKKTNI